MLEDARSDVRHDALVPDGFPGQRLLVLPRPRVREYLAQSGSGDLVVTDCGYFPRAHSHGRRRHSPIGQVIVMMCVDGAGWCETPAGRFTVEAGQAVILPPGVPHAYGADADDPWTVWWFHLAGPHLPEFLSAAKMTAANPVRRVHNLYQIVSLITEIVRWLERDSTTPSLLVASGAAWHALTLLAADRGVGDLSVDVVEESAQYLRTHVAERVTVAQLAAMASLSASHFAAVFKRHMGYPVLQYQTMLRMARARELLDLTDRTIATIAGEVGYPDSFYFARQFKKFHGVTPREYRRQHKG
ncbi:AraC family transcriptional regulator [Cellulomonas sp. WB94]|uniref:AraC family transcriptional regulator n=1 Tax=Cellulomonas sp. WB94 TaxID=2173174 RepID=UPI001304C3E7|nr:AraC family transcriptional regulator [Cellulomonas sp. WB94]